MNIPIEKVAELLCNFTGDSCPCNYNDIDMNPPMEECDMQCADEHYLGCWIRYIQREVNKCSQ